MSDGAAVSGDAEGAGTAAGSGVMSPPSAQAYTVLVLMEVEVSVAVVVDPAAIRVVVNTTVTGSVLVLGAALGVRVVPRSLDGMASPRGLVRFVGELEG